MSNIEASLRLDIAQYQAQLAKVQGDTKRTLERMKKEGKGLGTEMFKPLAGIAAGGGIVAGLILMGKKSLDTVVKVDRMTRALTAMEGGAAEAQAQLKSLQEVARLPGVDFEQAVSGFVKLRAVGLDAETSKKAISEFGNALALAGNTDLEGVIVALSQIASKGKVSAEEIGQIAERVPQIRQVMQNVFGTSDTEAIQKMGMASEEFIRRTIDGFGDLARAKAGLDEDLSDIRQSFVMLINEGAGPIVNELVPAMRELATWAALNKDAFGAMGTGAVSALRGIGTAFTAVSDTLAVGAYTLFGSDAPGNTPGMAGRTAAATAALAQRNNENDNFVSDQSRAAELGKSQSKGLDQKRLDLERQIAQLGLNNLSVSERVEKVQDRILMVRAEVAAFPPDGEDSLKAQKELVDLVEQERDLRKQITSEDTKTGETRAALEADIKEMILAQLPPTARMLELQDQIMQTRVEMASLSSDSLEGLTSQRDLLKLLGMEKVLRDDLDQADRQGREKSAEQQQNLEVFKAEMAILDANIRGQTQKAEAMQRTLDIMQLSKQLQDQMNLSEQEALRLATQRIDLERKASASGDASGTSDGKIHGYSRDRQGGSDAARGRANARTQSAYAESDASRSATFGGLNEFYTSQQRNPLGNKAEKNAAAQDRRPASGEGTAQQGLQLVSQILAALTGS